MRIILPVIIAALLAAAAAFYFLSQEASAPDQNPITPRSPAQQAGTIFQPYNSARTPAFIEINQSWFEGANSIWGATGRDDQGHIWLGVSGSESTPARLFEYDPASDAFTDHGDTVSALKANGIYRQGENQVKIHSKIVPMDDGWLYFSSMDESGENADEGQLPKWGSHLWRYRSSAGHWEHLFAAPEGLIAVSGVGRWVYALGYWGHVLYQYDTRTGETRHLRIGSEGGHISRNLIADKNGHVYVPRVIYFDLPPVTGNEPAESDRLLVVTLIEYDQYLNKVQGIPLINYADKGKPEDSHGITSLAYLEDGSIIFGTHTGFLYRITPDERGAATITELGWLHPDGESYNPALFPLDGKRYIAGITRRRGNGYQLFRYDIEQNESQPMTLNFPDYRNLLLYGSNTRDDQGRGYVVGRHEGNRPVILQMEF